MVHSKETSNQVALEIFSNKVVKDLNSIDTDQIKIISDKEATNISKEINNTFQQTLNLIITIDSKVRTLQVS